jgi:hypothetical protein
MSGEVKIKENDVLYSDDEKLKLETNGDEQCKGRCNLGID